MVLNFSERIPTYTVPTGALIDAHIIPILADLEAIRKWTGFAPHMARWFCWYCKCTLAFRHKWNHTEWEYRTNDEVRKLAQQWKDENRISEKTKLVKKSGVLWTPMHDLPYWEPVTHTLLGFMHNWLEGIIILSLKI